MLNFIVAIALLFIASISQAAEAGAKYSWASTPFNEELWGVAVGDVTGGGAREVVLLRRNGVRLGSFKGSAFVEAKFCSWEGPAKGARVSLMDVDADGTEDIIVSAVEGGTPASFILSFKGSECGELGKKFPWSLRAVADASGQKKLAGQGWSSDSFFFGPVYEFALDGGRLKRVGKMGVPPKTKLFEFAFAAGPEGEDIVLIKGFGKFEVRRKEGKGFRRLWRSSGRHGGTPNVLPTKERSVLGWVDREFVEFGTPPPVGGSRIFAVRHDEPLRGMVGQLPYIKGGEIDGFSPDAALGYAESYRTEHMSGAVADYIIVDTAGENGAKILVLLQREGGFFTESRQTVLLEFDIAPKISN